MPFAVTNIGGQQRGSGNPGISTVADIPAGALLVGVADEGNAVVTGTMTQVSGIGDTFSLVNNAQNNGANGMGQIFVINKTSGIIASGSTLNFFPNNNTHNSCAIWFYITGTNGGAAVVNATPVTGSGTTPSIGPIAIPLGAIVLGITTDNAGANSNWTEDAAYTNISTLSAVVASPGAIAGYILNTSSATHAPTLNVSRAWASFMLAYNPPPMLVRPALDGLSSLGEFGSGPLGFSPRKFVQKPRIIRPYL